VQTSRENEGAAIDPREKNQTTNLTYRPVVYDYPTINLTVEILNPFFINTAK
jgi:hypothetical protein